jgi:hypothetical protein
LKELPPEPETSVEKPKVQKTPPAKQTGEKQSVLKPKVLVKEKALPTADEEEKKSRLPVTYKDILLGIINLVSVILLVVILLRLPAKAKELKDLRLASMATRADISIEQRSVDEVKDEVEELKSLFLDEGGIVKFVDGIENLQGEGSSISAVTFASQRAVKDLSGNFGVPVNIQLVGSWGQIAEDIQKIELLPYLFRAVKIDIQRQEEDPNVIVFNYGLLLYTKNELGEN